ncbi:hypothetical protein EHS13_23060 [Paenibacillus psychroresistens]|uniref:Uncharacterized protein n=1 Tax=Paenibacillus psychroresistens TaxID=1778678 RepID=A0A6B8RPE5_9BACL|nr:hypothetical protein [Paenibacillus psychroresistens]QGQ97562.1 hypothetical protein EHS13_23060 [Paenibacillus psychroresistens]
MNIRTAFIGTGTLFILFSGVFEAMALSQNDNTKTRVDIVQSTPVETALIPSSSPDIEKDQLTSSVFTQEKIDKVYKAANMKPPESTNLPKDNSKEAQPSLDWIKDLRVDLESFNMNAADKDLANSAILLSKKWHNQVDQSHSEAFFGKKDNSDELFSLNSKINFLKTSGNRILDELDGDGQGKDFFIQSNSDDIKATIKQIKRITSQLVN